MMSYPPKEHHHAEDGVDSPLMEENGNGTAEHGKEEEDEEGIDLIRRYEDFSTVGTSILKKTASAGIAARLDPRLFT